MAKAPNFLVIMSDQHAPDVIGALGHPCVQTPALDRLVASGVAFTNAYCAYPMCTPSRASFMTGQLTPAHRVWELGSTLASDRPTWAHVLRKTGYTVSISGRMHFVGPDKMHGFERRVYPELGELDVPYSYADWSVPQSDEHIMVGAVQSAGPVEGATRAQLYDEAVTAAALDEMTELAAQSDSRPWALTVGYFLPHIPYTVSHEYFQRYEGAKIPAPRKPPGGVDYESTLPAAFRDCRKWLGLSSDGATPAEVATARRAYHGMVSHLDDLIGKLLARLRETSAAENTWIIYVSDHGDNLGEHGLWSKLSFYEDSVRVPMIIVPPQCAYPGSRCAAPVSLVDWTSTLLDLTGQPEVLGDLPGRSLLPLLRDPAQRWEERAVLSDYACGGTRVPMRMVRRGRWKAIFAPGFTPVLFDLENDPHEWHDLGAEKKYSDVLAELYSEATRDGWDGNALQQEILALQKQLRYISEAEAA